MGVHRLPIEDFSLLPKFPFLQSKPHHSNGDVPPPAFLLPLVFVSPFFFLTPLTIPLRPWFASDHRVTAGVVLFPCVFFHGEGFFPSPPSFFYSFTGIFLIYRILITLSLYALLSLSHLFPT